MANKYNIRCNEGTIELTKSMDTTIVYKIPYVAIKNKNVGFDIQNPFVVYILEGKNNKGKDYIYVGESRKGIENRPAAHEDKNVKWTNCYILTQFKERTFLNDSTIHYLEDKIKQLIDNSDMFENKTILTNKNIVNSNDEENCDEYLDKALEMLNVLGLNLFSEEESNVENNSGTNDPNLYDYSVIEDGTYDLIQRKIKKAGNRTFKARMEVSEGKFKILKDSEICEIDSPSLARNIAEARRIAIIEDGILKEDFSLDSPSACSQFVFGMSANGWLDWFKDKKCIDEFRNK